MRKKLTRFRRIFIVFISISIVFGILTWIFLDETFPDDFDFDVDENATNVEYRTRLSLFYPHLTSIIETENFTTLKNKTKLILLANGFFSNPTWSFASSSSDTMKTLTCPFLVDRCRITTDSKVFSRADAVVFHMRDDFNRRFAQRRRHHRQRFVFTLWESPQHTGDLKSFRQFFNWTMTYRLDSDIVASYFSGNSFFHRSSSFFQKLTKENSSFQPAFVEDRPSNETLAKKTLGTIAALISNCHGQSRRLLLIRELRKFIDVKIYGKCGEPCPSESNCREFLAEKFYFFLSFENSFCTDYTTEKFFATLPLPIVPIVFGRTNYSILIPSSGFIDVNEFSSVEQLAKFISMVRNDTETYLKYFTWKKDFVWAFPQFFRSFCDLCLRLHYDFRPKTIDDIHSWWHRDTCVQPKIIETFFHPLSKTKLRL